MERPADHALPDYADRVLTWAEAVPPGRVLTYGDIAALVAEGGPRQVGRVMATYGAAVPWWRVVRADGLPLPGGERRALEHYRAEGTPLRDVVPGSPSRVDMRRARWQPDPGQGPDAAEPRD
ncbi:MGMT family protein [Streptomyces spiramenti]|nr:MGMT family protein [Streptomyces spiramenti]